MPVFANVEQWNEWTLGASLLAAGAFGALGIFLLALGFKIFEWVTPKLNVEQELAKGNVAVGVATGALLLSIALIITRAIG